MTTAKKNPQRSVGKLRGVVDLGTQKKSTSQGVQDAEPRGGTQLRNAVVRVGHGRGFIVEAADCHIGRLVITAAHCLPRLPPAHPARSLKERTCKKLLGLPGAKLTLSA
jgi:hypothetical protein